MIETTVREEHHPADSAAAERLWDALHLARAGKSRRQVVELEDAAFWLYLPMTRTIAHAVTGQNAGMDRVAAASPEEAAELGLARAVLAWRDRTGAGFRRYARSVILQELLKR